MGKRGPAPKPTALRILHGDKANRINRQEPKALPLDPDPPGYLTTAAAAEWDRLVPHLMAMGTVQGPDEALLAAYCEAVARWKTLARLAARTPPSFPRKRKGPDGEDESYMVKNPLWSQVRDATDQLRVLAREFGFTPSARAGLRVDVTISGGPERLLTGGLG